MRKPQGFDGSLWTSLWLAALTNRAIIYKTSESQACCFRSSCENRMPSTASSRELPSGLLCWPTGRSSLIPRSLKLAAFALRARTAGLRQTASGSVTSVRNRQHWTGSFFSDRRHAQPRAAIWHRLIARTLSDGARSRINRQLFSGLKNRRYSPPLPPSAS